MPRYFFHLVDHSSERDHVGTNLPDIGAARVHSVRLLCDFLGRKSSHLFSGDSLRVQVTDEEGHMLFNLVTRAVAGDAALAQEREQIAS